MVCRRACGNGTFLMSTDGFFWGETLNTPDFFNTYTMAYTQQILIE